MESNERDWRETMMGGLIAGVASLAFAGCAGGVPTSAQSEAVACATGAWCGADATCVRGLCVRGCAEDPTRCSATQTCVDGACVTLGDDDPSDDTSPTCGADADCPMTGAACIATRCAELPAAMACDATRPCPSGSVCASGVCTARPCDASDPSTWGDPSDPSTACVPAPRPCDPSDPSTWRGSATGCGASTGPSDPSTGPGDPNVVSPRDPA